MVESPLLLNGEDNSLGMDKATFRRWMAMIANSTLTLALLLSVSSAAAAQSFSYPDFTDITGLTLNGTASQQGSALRVTGYTTNANGSFFYDTPVPVSPGFETTFTFQIDTLGTSGADGMAFAIHSDPRTGSALGDTGSALAYSSYPTSAPGTAIANSVVVELDTWLSSGDADSSDNEISIHTNGAGDNAHHENFSLGRVTPAIDMSDGLVHTVRIRYLPGRLDVFLDDLGTPVLGVAYDFATGGTFLLGGGPVGGLTLINGTDAYVGFTAATGGEREVHDTLSWEFGEATVGRRYCVSNPNSTGAPALINAFGSDSVSDNHLTVHSSPVPNQPGMFVYALTQVQVPFGDGFVCSVGSRGRLTPTVAVGNEAICVLDFPSLRMPINPGDTWNFQHLYRDPGFGAHFNSSDGLEIQFTP